MYNELDEQQLARRCSQKDRLAQDELYRRYAFRLHALCERYLGDKEEAKDLMLETLVRALDKIDTWKYSGKGSLYAWISRIAINKAINHIKRQRWRVLSLDSRVQDNLPEPTEEEMEEVPADRLREWISSLPDLRRSVFNLYCLDGYSHTEIGRILGISERASSSTLSRARKQLKEKIRQYLKEHNR